METCWHCVCGFLCVLQCVCCMYFMSSHVTHSIVQMSWTLPFFIFCFQQARVIFLNWSWTIARQAFWRGFSLDIRCFFSHFQSSFCTSSFFYSLKILMLTNESFRHKNSLYGSVVSTHNRQFCFVYLGTATNTQCTHISLAESRKNGRDNKIWLAWNIIYAPTRWFTTRL